jgi:hypothetical protein
MKVVRIVLALLVALSVAVLPAAGGVGAVAKSTEMADTAAMDDMDCCPHKANPCDKAMDGCSSMATCVLKCFTFSGTAASTVIFASHGAQLSPAFGANRFNSQTGSPPFRPPRV